MSGADFVKGSRFIQGAGTSDMSLIRMLGNWALTQSVRVLYGGSFSDLCYGYIAFWSKHVRTFQSACDGFEIEALMNVRALKCRLKIVEVASFEGLTVEYARSLGATTLVKGLRAYSDFDAELQQALMNRKLAPDIHTVFLMSSFAHIYVSSSILKDIASYGGNVSDLVPPPVARALKEKFR